MAVRFVITFTAAPGRGDDLAAAFKAVRGGYAAGTRLRAVRDFPGRGEPGQADPDGALDGAGGSGRACGAEQDPAAAGA